MSRHDPFPAVPDGVDVRATISVDGRAGSVEIDLRDNVDCLPNGLNLTESTSRTAAMLGVFNSVRAGVPPNAGSFRAIEVKLRQNCAVGVPVHPYSCSTATSNLADRVANAVQRGLAELGEGCGLAECGAVIPGASAVVSGHDPRSEQRRFVNQLFLAVTGGAGTPWTDGWLTIFHVGCAGMLRRDSVEIAELSFPIIVDEQRLVADSEGAGTYRGAPSARVEYGPRDTELVAAYGCDGADNPALGARGGLAGGAVRHFRRSVDGELTELPAYGLVTLADGERLISITAGGGGFGPPSAREPHAVQHDVIEGLVSRERAHDVYKVVLDDRLEVLEHETAVLRTG
jgi:N-methylhydantoinase B